MANVIGTVNDPGRVTAQIMAAVRAPNGISFKGEYDNKNTYKKYDWVTVNKNLAVYECIVTETTGDHPAILTEWKVVIQFPYGSSSSKGGEKVLGIDPVTGEFVVSNTFMEYLITNKGIWNAIDTYTKGDFVSVPENLGWYISKVDDNNNVSPVGGNDNWQVVTEIPGSGIVTSDTTDYSSYDLPTTLFVEDLFTALIANFQSYYIAKNLILAPADAWTPRQTNGATWQIDESTTNKQCKGVLVFSPSTEQAIQLEIKNLNGELITSANFKVKIHSKISGTDGSYDLSVFRTAPLAIPDYEEAESSYDKMASIWKGTTDALSQRVGDYFFYWLLYNGGSTWTPGTNSVVTSGSNGTNNSPVYTANRKKMAIADLHSAAYIMDKQGVPGNDRVCVLPSVMYHELAVEIGATSVANMQVAANYDPKLNTFLHVAGFKLVQRPLAWFSTAVTTYTAVSPANFLSPANTYCHAAFCFQSEFVEFALGETKIFESKDDALYFGSIYSGEVRAGGRPVYSANTGVVPILQAATA